MKDVFVQVSTSSRGACGITLEQNVKCWGSPTHMHEEMMQGSFTQISGGENVICGLRINGVIACVYGNFDMLSRASSSLPSLSAVVMQERQNRFKLLVLKEIILCKYLVGTITVVY